MYFELTKFILQDEGTFEYSHGNFGEQFEYNHGGQFYDQVFQSDNNGEQMYYQVSLSFVHLCDVEFIAVVDPKTGRIIKKGDNKIYPYYCRVCSIIELCLFKVLVSCRHKGKL